MSSQESVSEIFVFLHGFSQDGGVGGGGETAKRVASQCQVHIEQPNLNVPSFEKFSVSNAIKVIDELYNEKQANSSTERIQMNPIGASMGKFIDLEIEGNFI